MNMDSETAAPRENSPIMWQKRIGLLAVALMLLLIPIVISTGLHDSLRAFNEPVVLPLTPILIGTGALLSKCWFVLIPLFVGGYLFWINRSAKRLLWFNAVMSIVFPLALWGTIHVGIQQHSAIEKMLHQK